MLDQVYPERQIWKVIERIDPPRNYCQQIDDAREGMLEQLLRRYDKDGRVAKELFKRALTSSWADRSLQGRRLMMLSKLIDDHQMLEQVLQIMISLGDVTSVKELAERTGRSLSAAEIRQTLHCSRAHGMDQEQALYFIYQIAAPKDRRSLETWIISNFDSLVGAPH